LSPKIIIIYFFIFAGRIQAFFLQKQKYIKKYKKLPLLDFLFQEGENIKDTFSVMRD